MPRKRYLLITLALVLLVFATVLALRTLRPADQNNADPDPDTDTDTELVYRNDQYDFSFVLPETWRGHSIVNSKWEGFSLETNGITETGPLISIRHPLWTKENPRQDIPIMVFTIEQWNDMQEDKFHIGAAPINPRELARNDRYVFALPARYNFAFPTGYEEVDEIIESNPLRVKQGA